MICRLIFPGLFCLIAFAATAQYTITGKVVDRTDQNPMPFANVFLANTTKGVQTGMQGEFTLTNVPAGRLKLVISFVGYETQAIDFVTSERSSFVIQLQPSVTRLKELTITANKTSRGAWYDHFVLFRDHFIGKSENASACSFENPRVLHFDYENSRLTASADSLLVIENRGLGYRMKFQLEEYAMQKATASIKYVGFVLYEEMQPETDQEAMYWAQRRLKAYYGSEQHFLRTLRERKMMENGFYVNLLTKSFNKHGRLVVSGIADTTLTIKRGVYSKQRKKMDVLSNYNRVLDSLEAVRGRTTMKFDGELEIYYVDEAEPYYYQMSRNPRGAGYTNPQRSWIKLRAPLVEIAPDGQIVPEDGIESGGYWSWELVAESLPLDYDPKKDEQMRMGIDSRGSE